MIVKIKDDKSYIEDVCLNDITDSYTTPIYIYSQKIISDTYKHLKLHLSSEIFYSIKANSNQAILTLIKNLGAGADVVSAGELQRAISAGFNPDKIIFEGVGKSKNDIEYAIDKNIRLINAESLNEILLIDEIGKSLHKKVNIGVRLNPNIDGKTLEKISTGKKTDKFGIGIEKLPEIISLANTLNYIELKGISCHIGSQINDLNIFKKVFKTMKKAAEKTISSGINLEHLDLGGGFSVNYEEDLNSLDIKSIGDLIKSIFRDVKYKISFEPGRYLVAKAGILITKILTTKKNGNINFLVVDAGMQTLLRPSLYGAFHRIKSFDNKEGEIKYSVVGPICESTDIIAKDINLPKQRINNFIIVYDVGAYGFAMSSNYNSRGKPNEILINKNTFSLIHKEEKIDDIIKRDLVPNWLKIN